jgi:hypothetical protein
MTNYFETFTQYDNKYKELIKLGFNKSSCPTFAILTAHHFMEKPNEIKKWRHEKCVDYGVINYLYSGFEGMMTFDEMLQFTNLDKKGVMGTSVNMIITEVVGFNQIIKNVHDKPYCVIFLKNAKFFVAMMNDKIYSIRDCHESIQYDFTSRDELINHLMTVYNFCEPMNIDGYTSNELDEFNNIEFLVIEKKFNMTLDETIEIEGMHNDYNISILDEIDETIDEITDIEIQNNIIIEL